MFEVNLQKQVCSPEGVREGQRAELVCICIGPINRGKQTCKDVEKEQLDCRQEVGIGPLKSQRLIFLQISNLKVQIQSVSFPTGLPPACVFIWLFKKIFCSSGA
jgi:hypothetical protein